MFTKNRFSKVFLSSLFLVFLFLSSTINATPNFPTPTSYKYSNDYVGVISDSEAQSIVSLGKELEDKTGAQSTVVVIDSTNGVPIEDYTNKLFRTWGIGEKSKDNGFLILLAINDKSWRVEVGRGLEGAIPDALSNRVMESIAKPSFINGNYGEGLINSYSVFADSIATEYGVTLDKSLHVTLPDTNTTTNTSNNGSNLFSLIGLGFVVVLFLGDIIFNHGRVSSTLLQLMFISSLGRRNGPRGGSGGGGGGFGGFGGGSSNGGGSSGGW